MQLCPIELTERVIMKINIFGKTVLVDNEIGDLLHVEDLLIKKGYVAVRTSRCRSIFLHKIIMGKPPKGFVTDHINRNKLDNRRCNLRFLTYRMNTLNTERSIDTAVKAIEKILDR